MESLNYGAIWYELLDSKSTIVRYCSALYSYICEKGVTHSTSYRNKISICRVLTTEVYYCQLRYIIINLLQIEFMKIDYWLFEDKDHVPDRFYDIKLWYCDIYQQIIRECEIGLKQKKYSKRFSRRISWKRIW